MSAGADLLVITDRETPAARVNPVAAAVVLRDRLAAGVMLQMEAADRSLAALEADLLGAHALGVQTVVCRSGTPRVAGDYPDSYSLWDVDSVRLIAALSGLNDGVDWRGVTIPDQTRFVIGASFDTSAVDLRAELGRTEEKVRAGAHFLLTDVIYDADSSFRALAELRGPRHRCAGHRRAGAVRRPEGDRPAHPRGPRGIRAAPGAGRAARRGRPGRPVNSAVGCVHKLRDLASGVLIHAPPRPDGPDDQAGRPAEPVAARTVTAAPAGSGGTGPARDRPGSADPPDVVAGLSRATRCTGG